MTTDKLAMALALVTTYVQHASVPVHGFQALIADTYNTINSLGEPVPDPEPEFKPAVPIKKSVTPDALISLIDGKSYKTLRRHLATHGLTPEQYRARYNLPADYPMVSSNYSAARANLAKEAGLGQRNSAAARAAKPAAETAAAAEKPKAKRAAKKPAAETASEAKPPENPSGGEPAQEPAAETADKPKAKPGLI